MNTATDIKAFVKSIDSDDDLERILHIVEERAEGQIQTEGAVDDFVVLVILAIVAEQECRKQAAS